ncbi:MAG: glycosyltransferase [Ruminococcus sp.]
MEALILSCGTGGGHNSAGKAVMEELKRRNHNAVMLNPYNLRSKKLAGKINNVYIYLAQKAPRFFGVVYGAGQFYRKLPFRSPVYFINHLMVSTLSEYLEENHFDIIIMTHLFPAEIITNMKNDGITVPKTMFIGTDYTCIPFTEETDCDVYVIPSPEQTDDYINKGIEKEKLYPLGIPVMSRFSETENREKIREKLGLDSDKKYILVSGGSMGGGQIKKAVKTLSSVIADCENTELIVICGNNKKLYDKLKAAEYPKVNVHGYCENMAEYMKAASLFVTKPGGLSSTEAAVSNVPILHTAAIPGCETHNAEFFSKNGMSKLCKASKRELSDAIKIIDDEKACLAITENQRRKINSNAATDICDLAEKLCE